MLEIFKKDNFEIRVLGNENNPLFVATDVCKVLGYTNTTVAIEKLDEDERSKESLGRQGDANVITESGLYTLIIRSDKPEAKPFRKWVTGEVLPQIRKTGKYELQQDSYMIEDPLERAKRWVVEAEEKKALADKIEFDAPKVNYATAVSGTNNPVSLREWINSLKSDQGLGVGERKVIKYLVESGMLYRTKDGKLKAYAKHDKQFSLIPIVFATPDGNRETFQLKITGLGQLEVSQQVLNHFKEQ